MASHEPSRDKGMSTGVEFLTFQHSRTNQGSSFSTRPAINHGTVSVGLKDIVLNISSKSLCLIRLHSKIVVLNSQVNRMSSALSASISGIMMPVQQLLSPNDGVMDTLSGLSIEQLSSMEETLRRAKMNRQKPSGSTASFLPSAPSRHRARPPPVSTSAASMKQFMSVMSSVPKDPSPPAKPSIKIVDGVSWLTFAYTTRSAASTSYTVRADIDQVSLDDIPAEVQQLNCLYPSANGAEEDYKGSRRSYEQECNEQGWKLTHLNPMVLSDRKGVLQRAVISLRNASSEQKSRRVKRQEKKTQSTAVERDVRGPVISIPRLATPRASRTLVPVPLTWQPAMVSSLQEGAQRPVPSDLTPQQHSQPQVQTAPQPTQRLPSLGLFETSTNDLSSLEFDGYIQGQFKRLRLQINIGSISLDNLPHDFKKKNCVYPRSFLTHGDQSEHWNTFGIRQAEESFLNEIGWKLVRGSACEYGLDDAYSKFSLTVFSTINKQIVLDQQ